METRPVQRSGRAYSLYLPLDWIKRASLAKGGLLQIEETPEGLVLRPAKAAEPRFKVREIKILAGQYGFEFVNRLIGWAYINGYNKLMIDFERPLSIKEVLRHKQRLKSVGLSGEITNISENGVTFYWAETAFVSPKLLLLNMFNEVLNLVRAIEQGEQELVTHYDEEINKTKHQIWRAVRQSVTTPFILAGSGLGPQDCIAIDYICYHLRRVSKLVRSNAGESNTKLLKQLLLLSSTVENPDVNALFEFQKILTGIKNKQLAEELAKVHRQLLSLWLH